MRERARSICGVWHRTPFTRKDGSEGSDLSLDLTRLDEVEAFLDRYDPTLLINCAAWPDIDPCESDPEGAERINVELPARMAALCRKSGTLLVHFSTDQVFDGERGGYTETSPHSPVHVYGRTKAMSEKRVLEADPEAIVARIPLVYGRSWTGIRSASEKLVLAMEREERLGLYTNEYRCPVLSDDVALAVLFLVEAGFSGLIQIAGPERLSRMEFARAVARRFGLDEGKLEPALSGGLSEKPRRPLDLSLDTTLLRSILPFPVKRVEDGLAQGV